MNVLKKLRPAPVWEIFEAICEIPHPSGHEEKLAAAVMALAGRHGLTARRDAAGNVRIDRPAAPGFETRPTVLLQGHLDMVPQAAATAAFDFLTDPIPLKTDGRWVSSAAETTLGADNGLGVAAALALLLDPELKAGPLAGVFTVSEEVGLNGALGLDPEFLNGDCLLNLDSEEEGELYIGCAGGARLEADFDIPFEPVPAGAVGVTAEVRNLAGGHSGINIGDRRGNAVLFAARLLECCPELRVAGFTSGTLDNVIPREASVFAAVAPGILPDLRLRAAKVAGELAAGFDAPAQFRIELRPATLPERVWAAPFQARVVRALATCPNGVIARDLEFGIVRTSSNLAAVRAAGPVLTVRTSQRSLADGERVALTELVADHFRAAGAAIRVDHPYPGWEPDAGSALLAHACDLYRKLFGREAAVKVIHAGLECGILAGLNPKLQMVSFGPTILDPHSPSERADVASTERFYRFLRQLVSQL